MGCKVIVKEVRLIYLYHWVYIWLPDQFKYDNITKVERALNPEIRQNDYSTPNNMDSNPRGYSAHSATQLARP